MACEKADGSEDSTECTSMAPDSDPGPHLDQALNVEALVQAVVHRLRASTWSGTAIGPGGAFSWQAARPGHTGGQQVVGLHALEVDGAPLAAAHAGQHQGPG